MTYDEAIAKIDAMDTSPGSNTYAEGHVHDLRRGDSGDQRHGHVPQHVMWSRRRLTAPIPTPPPIPR